MSNWMTTGKAWTFGDNVPNDEGIMPLKMVRLQEYDPEVLAKHCFEQIDPEFAPNAGRGDVVVGGRNFGFGNPHIQGFLGLKGVGVGLVVESMARGPLRACINAGVPVLSNAKGITAMVERGDELQVDFATGLVRNLTQNTEMTVAPMPAVMREIVGAGGGIGYMRKRLGLADAATA